MAHNCKKSKIQSYGQIIDNNGCANVRCTMCSLIFAINSIFMGKSRCLKFYSLTFQKPFHNHFL